MKTLLLLFASTHHAIKAEKVLLGAGARCQVIAVPKSISTECGLAIRISASEKGSIENLLVAKKVKCTFYEEKTGEY